MQRFLPILIGLIALILIGVGVYFFFFRDGGGMTAEDGGPSFGLSDDLAGIPEEGELPLGEVDQQAGDEVAPRLLRITEGPVAIGAVAFGIGGTGTTTGTSTPTKKDTEIRYVERASGNVYAYRAAERSLSRISNRTLPGAQDAAWLSDGSLVFIRFLGDTGGKETIQTYALPVEEGVEAYFLEPNLSDIAVRGTSTVVTLLPSSAGSVATAASPDGESVRTFFASAIRDLRIGFSGSSLTAHTNASAHSNGYVFLAGTDGSFNRVAGPLRGLTALGSPSGKYIFYTYLSGNSQRAEILDVATRTSTSIPLGALSEKCAWAPDEAAIYCAVPRSFSGTMPDDWYQGITSFSDRIWRVDLAGRLALLVIDPSSVANVDIDAVGLTTDAAQDVLVFTNKTDGSLWMYDL